MELDFLNPCELELSFKEHMSVSPKMLDWEGYGLVNVFLDMFQVKADLSWSFSISIEIFVELPVG